MYSPAFFLVLLDLDAFAFFTGLLAARFVFFLMSGSSSEEEEEEEWSEATTGEETNTQIQHFFTVIRVKYLLLSMNESGFKYLRHLSRI